MGFSADVSTFPPAYVDNAIRCKYFSFSEKHSAAAKIESLKREKLVKIILSHSNEVTLNSESFFLRSKMFTVKA